MGILRSSQLPPGNPFIFTTMDAWKLRTGRRYAGICPGFASLQHNPFKRTAQGTHTMRRVLTKRITQHAYTNAVEGTSCYVLRVQHHPHRNHHHHQRHRIEGGCSIAFLVSFSHYFILFFFCIFRPISGRVLWKTLRRSCAFCSIFGFGSCAMRRTTPTQFQGTGSEVGSGSKSGSVSV